MRGTDQLFNRSSIKQDATTENEAAFLNKTWTLSYQQYLSHFSKFNLPLFEYLSSNTPSVCMKINVQWTVLQKMLPQFLFGKCMPHFHLKNACVLSKLYYRLFLCRIDLCQPIILSYTCQIYELQQKLVFYGVYIIENLFMMICVHSSNAESRWNHSFGT